MLRLRRFISQLTSSLLLLHSPFFPFSLRSTTNQISFPQMRSHQLPYYTTPSDDNDKDKSKRFKPHQYHPHSHSSFPSRGFLLLFSGVSLLLAVSSLIYAFSASPPPTKTVKVYRCGRAEDSLRTHLSSSTGVEAAARPKVVGLVGVQTGFGSASAGKRAALRSTWFPSDPDELVRLEVANPVMRTIGFVVFTD